MIIDQQGLGVIIHLYATMIDGLVGLLVGRLAEIMT